MHFKPQLSFCPLEVTDEDSLEGLSVLFQFSSGLLLSRVDSFGLELGYETIEFLLLLLHYGKILIMRSRRLTELCPFIGCSRAAKYEDLVPVVLRHFDFI